MKNLLNYFGHLRTAKIILWCYVIWYLVIVSFYFDPRMSLWINSIGISAVMGTGLMLSVMPAAGLRAMEKWAVARLFIIPFCVSSFAALIKDHGFVVVFSPRLTDNLAAAGACTAFVTIALLCKFTHRRG